MNDTSSPAPSANDAINAALSQQWDEAIRINLHILEENPDDIDAYNRLAFAYLQKEEIEQAKTAYQEVLKRDPYNQIAQKNLKKLEDPKASNGKTQIVSPRVFLEEPGKTKIISCVKLAPASTLAQVSCGQEVQMKVKKHCIEIRTTANTYLGALPDDISHKLNKYIQAGNQYQAIVRSIGKNLLTVLLREIARGEKYKDQPSFTSSRVYVPSPARVEPSRDMDDATSCEEQEE